jgi:phage/plasmid primase-like uncharacterized protein
VASAADIARNLGAQRQGHDWRCACPLECGYSLSLSDGEDGRLLAHCFGGCEYTEVVASLVEYGLLDDGGDAGYCDASPSIESREADESARSEAACWIYAHIAPAAGTIVETYLRSRGITLEVPSILRFGNCPHRNGGLPPAMAAPVVNVDGEQTGIHMTYLRADGSGKADLGDPELQRECRGVVRGGAIRLAPHDPDRELIIGEGIETVLSAMQIFGLPGWAAVSADGLKTVELPLAVRSIVITVDNDINGAGQRNALAAYQRWTDEGRSVRIVMPPLSGTDFNDIILMKKGV